MSTLLFKHVNVVDVRNQQILSDVMLDSKMKE